MSTLNREEVSTKLGLIEERIAVIKATEFEYSTSNKYLPGIGSIFELKTVNEAVKAMKYINDNSESFDSNAEELGLTEEDVEEVKILGFKVSVWKKDIFNRVQEIKMQAELVNLKTAKKLLVKHLSKDDIFDRDMASIGKTLDKFKEEDTLIDLEKAE